MATKKPEFIESIGPDGKRVLSNILDQFTGDQITYKEVDRHIDGSFMSDEKLDPERILYIKKNGRYFKQNFDLFIPASRIGMVANDDSKGGFNYGRLLYALKTGVPLLIDGVFHITQSSLEDAVINSPIRIKGINQRESKLITSGGSGGSFMRPKKDCEIKDISIICQGVTTTRLITYDGDFDASVYISGIYAEGYLRLLTSSVDVNHDYDLSFTGFRNITIVQSNFVDVNSLFGFKTIISLVDVIAEEVVLTDNEITNFSYVFANIGVTNNHPQGDIIKRGRKLLSMHRNKVICEDDYDAFAANNGAVETYYCFVLYEGTRVICKDNHFEGFHLIDNWCAIYDNYFTAALVIYEGNFWKNIVNFTPDLENGILGLMKTKGGESDSLKSEKFFRNNNFVVEPEYADKMGQDRFLLRKVITGITNEQENVVIENNTFNVYILSDIYATNSHIINYTFNNNIINAYTAEVGFVPQSLITVREHSGKSSFTNNTIKVQNPPLPEYKTYSIVGNSLIWNEASGLSDASVIFKNNYIEMYGLFAIFRDLRNEETLDLEGDNWRNTIFEGNTIKMLDAPELTYVITNSMSTFMPYDESNRIHINGEDINSRLHLFYSSIGGNRLPPINKKKFSIFYNDGSLSIRIFRFQELVDRPAEITLEFAITSEVKTQYYTVNFTITPGDNFNTIDAVARDVFSGETEYTQQSYLLDGSGRGFSNLFLEKNNETGGDLSLINIGNNPSHRYLELLLTGSERTPNMQLDITVSISPL